MQCSFRISFTLKSVTPSLRASFDSINTICPNQTLGSHIARKPGNLKRLKLILPILKKNISFTISDENHQQIGEQIQLYNLVCSLQKCSIVHFLNEDGVLDISIVASMEDAEFISAYYKSLKSEE